MRRFATAAVRAEHPHVRKRFAAKNAFGFQRAVHVYCITPALGNSSNSTNSSGSSLTTSINTTTVSAAYNVISTSDVPLPSQPVTNFSPSDSSLLNATIAISAAQAACLGPVTNLSIYLQCSTFIKITYMVGDCSDDIMASVYIYNILYIYIYI